MIYLITLFGLSTFVILMAIVYQLYLIAHIMKEIDSDILYVHSLLIELRSTK